MALFSAPLPRCCGCSLVWLSVAVPDPPTHLQLASDSKEDGTVVCSWGPPDNAHGLIREYIVSGPTFSQLPLSSPAFRFSGPLFRNARCLGVGLLRRVKTGIFPSLEHGLDNCSGFYSGVVILLM